MNYWKMKERIGYLTTDRDEHRDRLRQAEWKIMALEKAVAKLLVDAGAPVKHCRERTFAEIVGSPDGK